MSDIAWSSGQDLDIFRSTIQDLKRRMHRVYGIRTIMVQGFRV